MPARPLLQKPPPFSLLSLAPITITTLKATTACSCSAHITNTTTTTTTNNNNNNRRPSITL
jgi:hypothetical protein